MTQETKQTIINAAIGAWCLVGLAFVGVGVAMHIHMCMQVVH